MVTIAVTGERDGEPRVAVSPETVKKLTGLGCTVRVQAGAGAQSRFADSLLEAQGAKIAASAIVAGERQRRHHRARRVLCGLASYRL